MRNHGQRHQFKTYRSGHDISLDEHFIFELPRCCSFSNINNSNPNFIQMNSFVDEVIEKYEEKEKQFDKRLQHL